MPGSDDDFKAAIEVLTKNLNLVPASAVPAIIDCVVASTGLSPSALFTALLDAFPKLSKDFLMGECTILGVGCSGYIISFIRSLIYLIKNFGIEPDALELFICRVFVPLLKQTNQNDSKLLNQIVEVLCEVVIETQAWDLMDATLVPNSLSSLGISLGKLHNGESSMYQRSQEATLLVSGSFPLSVACHILSSLLSAALGSYQADLSPVEMKVVNRRGSPENFAKQLVGDLSDMAVSMLFQTSDLRSYAIRAFLPSIFRAFDAFSSFEVSLFGRISVLSREYFSREVWNCCKYLLSLGPLERQDVYLILSLSLYSFFPVKGCKILSSSNGAEEFDIRAEKEFWQEIRRGLVDKEALVRKQALHVLKIALGSYSCSPSDDKSQSQTATNGASNNGPMILHDASSTPVNMTRRDKWAETEARSLGVGRICNSSYFCLGGQQRWQGFLLLYEMLEEYGAHLVEAAWVHQVSLLLGFYSPSDSSVDPIRSGIYHIQMESLEGIFSWLVVLWEQGFCHGNPQVRCLIMQSFLATDWENHGNCAKLVPESFVLGPFVQGLSDPVHHKNFGVKGVYSSETIEGAAKFFRHFSSCFSRREQVAFVYNLASVAKQESFGRAGLMALAVCLASAAGGTKVREVEFYQDNLLCKSSSDLIEALQLILERSKQHFNPNYRLQVCDQVLAAATSLASPCDMSPDVLLHFISTLPHEFTACDGSLRGKVLNWFYWSDGVYNGFNSSISRTQFLKEFCDFPEGFMKHNSCDTFVCYDDEDLDLWTSEAQRWARMLFLVIAEEEHFEPIYAFLHKYGKQICEKNQNLEVVPVKFLVLIFALVQEFQIQQETFHRNHGDVSIKTKVDQCILAGTLNVKRFTRHFIFILEGLWSFSRSVCSVFWSSNIIQDAVLPGSITGKLGGPSQRRLPSPTTTAVLRAISSLKAVASLSSWCALLNGDSCVDSAITFLWNISWKIIMSSSHNSETGAEIRLAAYEALVPVLKALSTTFSSLSFDLVMNYNNTIHVNVEDQPLLDLLGLTFLQNVNDLLAAGTLARSRRAVLMQWKWCCLDCLLSIPGKYIENGAQMGTTSPFFSHAALRSVFVDLVESLENAGESSILPMLRSVRMVLGLSFSGRMSSTVSSCDVIDTQMMWQLVQSVWVLHVNCNKRRVGPIAALLSSVLHSSLFNDLSMHEAAGNEKGPLKWFVEKILYEGVKSPRTILLAALHLTGLWLLYPRTIKYYMKELKLLTFYGSVAFDEDFEAELAENQDARKEFLLLSSSPDPELTEAFFSTEMYARVSVAVLFHKLADSANRSQALKKNEDALAALACGKMFLLELLDAVVNDKDLAKELYKKYSKIHRHKVRAWQMICVLSQFADENIVQQVTSSLHICLYRNNLPAVRQYLEIFAIQIYLKFPSLISEQFIPIFHDYNMRPQALSSYVFIAANVMLHSTEVHVQLKHLDDLLPPMIPFLTSHHHSLRGFTQVLVYQVLCKLIPAVDPNSSEVMPLEKKCFQALKSYLHTNSDCTRLRTSLEGILGAFDPNISATPAGLFSSKHEELEFECMPTPLMEQVINFLNDVREDLRYSMANDVIAIKNEGLRVEETSEETISSSKADEERLSSQIYKDVPLDFQKKVTLHQHERREFHANIRLNDAKIQMPLEDMEKEDRLLCSTVQSRNVAMERFRESRQQFILVASLLDRIPNLAGLARTCEVFKATGLTIADASVVHDRQFQLISVTAEKWVPIIEVPIGSIKTFLEKKKQEGFSILGLEQTANSTPLDKYSFPKKTVLVLGREKEGIPVDIIHVLDASLEIPQLGVVRSLNVHVSGAIALWEYTRQQRTKQP